MYLRVATVSAIAAAVFAAPAPAHHSFAMFEANRTLTLRGTVNDFEWVNPHSRLRIVVNDERTGRPVLWTLELGAPSQLITMGIYPNSLKPGDVVSVSIHPMKDGSHAGLVVQGTVAR